MISSKLIADKIEAVIKKMFVELGTSEIGVSEYSLLYDPKKHSSWFIVIFFSDKNQLKVGLRSGICHVIHSYLSNGLNEIEEISNINRLISFESGKCPKEKQSADNLFVKSLARMHGLQKEEQNAGSLFNKLLAGTGWLRKIFGESNVKTCGMCGHDFKKHEMLFDGKSGKLDRATEGWTICPEENCNCFQTWSISPEVGGNLLKNIKYGSPGEVVKCAEEAAKD
ncbi:MAG: hypothetical protein WC120_01935 [Parcubacteria group bacterium]